MRGSVVIVVVAALSACGRGDNAVKRCDKALAELPNAPAASRARHVLMGCKDIFAVKGCRDAWRRAADAPASDKIAVMFEGCRAAYCPKLGNPTPDACNKDFKRDTSSFEARMRYNGAWSQLMRRALLRDLGTKDAERLAWQLNRLRLAMSASPWEDRSRAAPDRALPAPPPPKVTLVVRYDDAGDITLSLTGEVTPGDAGTLTWTVPAKARRKELAAIAKTVARHAGTSIALDASKRMKYRSVYRVMSALRKAGVEQIQVVGNL